MFHPAVLIISVLIAAILIAGVALLLDGIRHQLKSVRKPNLRPQNTHPVNVLPDTRFVFQGQPSLLAAVREEGLDIVDSDCQAGSCGRCKMRLVNGEVCWRIQPQYETRADEVLLCCCIPKNEITLTH